MKKIRIQIKEIILKRRLGPWLWDGWESIDGRFLVGDTRHFIEFGEVLVRYSSGRWQTRGTRLP